MLHRIIKIFGPVPTDLREDIARLEAFLSAFPGEYCAFAPDGHVIASAHLHELLGVARLARLSDLLAAFDTGQATQIEVAFSRFQATAIPFQMLVTPLARPDRFYRLHMTRGQSSGAESALYNILWLEDVTAAHHDLTHAQDENTTLQARVSVLESALDHLSWPISLRQKDGALDWVNAPYAALRGQMRGEVIAQDTSLPTPARSDTQRAATLATAALQTGVTQHSEGHAVIKGTRHLLRQREIPLPGHALSLGITEDRTEAEDTARTVKRQIEAYHALLEQLQAATAIFDHDERLTFFNAAFATIWQVEEAFLHTRPRLGDLLERLRELRRLPEQADFRSYKQDWQAMFTNLIAPHQDMMYLPDGTVLRALIMPHTLGGLMMVFEDVTSRLEMEASYNTLVAVQKETLDNLSEAVAVYGGDGRLKLCNPAFASLWDLPAEVLQGEPHITRVTDRTKSLFKAQDWDQARLALLTQGLEPGSAKSHMLRRADGKVVSCQSMALPDGGGLVTHIDVTDTIQVQEALAARNAALEEAERVKGSFLTNVSYQLRTPLNALIGFNELLHQEFFGPLNDKQREYTQGMRDAGSRLQHLIDALLDLTTMEAGYFTLNKEETNLDILLRDIHDLAQEWGRSTGQLITLDVSKNALGTAEIDGPRMKQAVFHLLQYALSRTGAGDVITLAAHYMPDQALKISVLDHGRALDAAAQATLFTHFAPTKDDMPQGNDSGLGLSLVQKIAELHGGKVAVESSPTATEIAIIL